MPVTQATIDGVCEVLRGGLFYVQGCSAGGRPNGRDRDAITRIIEAVNTADIGVPEIEDAIHNLEGCYAGDDEHVITNEEVAAECVREAGEGKADAEGYDVDGYSCRITF